MKQYDLRTDELVLDTQLVRAGIRRLNRAIKKMEDGPARQIIEEELRKSQEHLKELEERLKDADSKDRQILAELSRGNHS